MRWTHGASGLRTNRTKGRNKWDWGFSLPSRIAHNHKPGKWPRFPKRELTLRSNDHSFTLTLTPRAQMVGLAALALACCGSLAAFVSLAYERREMREMQALLLDQEVQVEEGKSRITAFRDELDDATRQLEQRQAFLEKMAEMLPDDGAMADNPAADGSGGDAEGADPGAAEARLRKLGAALPEARGFASLARRQLALVDKLTTYAERRSAAAEQGIRRLGLDPRGIAAATRGSVQQGMGGPLEKLATEADGSLDPRFERMGRNLARMAALEQGLARVPQVMPTDLARMTSRFGYRRDPITGDAAMHAGLDFGGRTGDPIRAAADGTVSYVGYRSGYGKVVEISHGNGLTTRYAHMSAWNAHRGEEVAAGDVVGQIGSTGRSTGPHLHFEVRVGDRAVNPRPFLESAAAILAKMYD